MELTLVRLRDEDMNYVYFWVETYNDEVVSPTFESKEDAHLWADVIQWKLKKAIDKARL
jgi:hypothetical protein